MSGRGVFGSRGITGIRLWAIMISGVFSLPAGAALAQDVPLRWKLETGQTLGYEFSQQNQVEITLPNQLIETKNTLTIGLKWEVLSAKEDGSAQIKQLVDYVRVAVEAPGQGEMVYDSRAQGEVPKAVEQLKKLYDSVIGQEYEFTLDAMGIVKDVKVPDAVLAAVEGSPAAGLADGGSVLSARGLENLYAQVIPMLPGKAAETGATWDRTLDLPAGPLQMTVVNKYTLDKADAKEWIVKATVDTAIKPSTDTPLDLDLNEQSGTGTYTFDGATGELSSTEVSQQLKMTLKSMGREIPQKIQIEARLKPRNDLK